ncbi:50S ribosomal protein L11 methyltransferase [Geminicoccaceae bacterium 1502E]|nr:50S ribosomal protein L11 methyltransferase [Geminicoccaceae bacterium 1502E]
MQLTTTWPEPVGSKLWRASFVAPASAMPGLLEAVEELAVSTSIFEHEADESAETVSWRVDLITDEQPDLEALRRTLAPRCEAFGFALGELEAEAIPDTDWLAATAMSHPPVIAGRFAVHGAHARDEVPEGLLRVQVEAGLAFGSGEHATTQACLEALDRVATVRRFRRVLDLGCGSAVLGMAAARCSPCRVIAADNDPVAVRVAAENVAINGMSARIRCLVSEGYAAPALRRAAPYDLVLANILADPLCAMAGDLARHLAMGGMAILSGFLDRQVETVARAHRAHGLRVRWQFDRTPWAALVVERPGGH